MELKNEKEATRTQNNLELNQKPECSQETKEEITTTPRNLTRKGLPGLEHGQHDSQIA